MKPGTRVVLEWLRVRGEQGGTHLEAIYAVGCGRLAARVSELREEGYDIRSDFETTPGQSRISRYRLHETAEPVQLGLPDFPVSATERVPLVARGAHQAAGQNQAAASGRR